MPETALAQLLFRELEKIAGRKDQEPLAMVEAYYQLFVLVFLEATRQERLRFTTLFSRVAYACQKYRFNRTLQFYVHAFRKHAADALRDRAIPDEQSFLPALGLKVTAACITGLFDTPVPAELSGLVPEEWPYAQRPAEITAFKAGARVVALGDDPHQKQLLIKDEATPELDLRLQYDLADRNELFNPSIEAIRQTIGFPVILQLLEVEIDRQGVYRPRALVIEPDYLVDVSAIAECFNDTGAVPESYLLKKFLPFSASPALLLGNIANFFLDELLHQPEQEFRKLFAKVFRLNPLAFALLDDRSIKELMNQAQKHFVNLRQVILRDFPEQGIQPAQCYLEPTFYGSEYGIQGRLDVFFHKGKSSAIVELKSGKLFRPNAYGINPSHYIQTLLYDLIIRSVFGKAIDPANYILYSGIDERHLRFAPVVRTQQYEALQVRNLIIGLERQLMQLGCNGSLGAEDLLKQGRRFFAQLQPGRFLQAPSYVLRDLDMLVQRYQQASPLEKRYFLAFSGFIAREHKLSKTGIDELETVNGQASLWRNGFAEKNDNFEILSHLEILENHAREETPVIRFRKTELTNELANFRAGDIAVLYPFNGHEHTPLTNQLFKCTITEITPETVAVQLRARQSNDQLFREAAAWNLEHDLMDTSFVGMYRGLFDFLGAPERSRQLLLGAIPPGKGAGPKALDQLHPAIAREMTGEQLDIFRRILASKDYFLLWGPPGTGKTSVMLKHLAGYLLDHTPETILLLGYTNRSVDEICAAIESHDPSVRKQYLRIGSRFSTAPEFQDRLLVVQAEQLSTRQELRDLIAGQRIIVATLASITGRPELLDLKSFDRVIIDEASQILEPMLVGLLSRFKHALLIGDHKQLPAVVAQDEGLSAVEDPELQQIGLNNLRNSYFERLYRQCQNKGWDWAFAQLSHQGRMHRDIMAFPNRFFYEGALHILPPDTKGHERQIAATDYFLGETIEALEKVLASERLVFLPTPSDERGAARKTNLYEAQLTGEVVRIFQRLYAQRNRPFHANTIGVITPYRAQIAQIRQALQEKQIDPQQITIDTVERYQGGARDIIIISLCTNSLSQLRSLVSLSEEGVDRKLNVALTRAREHLVILGNPELLERNEIYRELIRKFARLVELD